MGIKDQTENWGSKKPDKKGEEKKKILPGLEHYLQFQKPHNAMRNKIWKLKSKILP